MTDNWTDNRKAAVVNATRAQENANTVASELVDDDGQVPFGAVLALSQLIASTAQVFATLELADAVRSRARCRAQRVHEPQRVLVRCELDVHDAELLHQAAGGQW